MKMDYCAFPLTHENLQIFMLGKGGRNRNNAKTSFCKTTYIKRKDKDFCFDFDRVIINSSNEYFISSKANFNALVELFHSTPNFKVRYDYRSQTKIINDVYLIPLTNYSDNKGTTYIFSKEGKLLSPEQDVSYVCGYLEEKEKEILFRKYLKTGAEIRHPESYIPSEILLGSAINFIEKHKWTKEKLKLHLISVSNIYKESIPSRYLPFNLYTLIDSTRKEELLPKLIYIRDKRKDKITKGLY